MSSLSKVTVEVLDKKKMYLMIERIHPDAPSLKWLLDQNDLKIKETLLFRIILLLETFQKGKNEFSILYKNIFSLLSPFVEEEYDKTIELNRYTELSNYDSEILENIVDQIIFSVKLIDKDINNNWEKGLIKNFNPFKSNESKIPYLKYELQFRNEILEKKYSKQTNYSALSISCNSKY